MTVNKFYSFSIRPNGIQMDFSRKDKLIENLLDYCLDVQYIAVHMNEREAFKKPNLNLKLKGKILNLSVKFLKFEVLKNRFKIN